MDRELQQKDTERYLGESFPKQEAENAKHQWYWQYSCEEKLCTEESFSRTIRDLVKCCGELNNGVKTIK